MLRSPATRLSFGPPLHAMKQSAVATAAPSEEEGFTGWHFQQTEQTVYRAGGDARYPVRNQGPNRNPIRGAVFSLSDESGVAPKALFDTRGAKRRLPRKTAKQTTARRLLPLSASPALSPMLVVFA
ncbi:hypothetical protein HPB47_025722 [Ixodes persulcatus]|uniref:Uncharacterized protein n=1 Tax=Ixodes persulcatus TaxID=34615 RepID=A0AC60Q339_IXOPE|nr:hypothetical protein HPB47_025722 [Ixodes persulcatus]